MASRSRKRAFTLVELLVVLGCIAVLVSLLLPAVNKVRRQANAVACTSNQKQIYTGEQQYATTYGGWIMWGVYVKSPNSGVLLGTPTWLNVLYDMPSFSASGSWRSKKNFVGPIRTAYCPSQDPQEPRDAAGNPTGAFRGSYGINKQMFWAGTGPYYVINDGGSLNYYYNLMRTRHAAQMYLFGDTQRNQYDFLYSTADLRHDKGLNITFHDGHVEWVPGYKFPTNVTITPGGWPWRCLN